MHETVSADTAPAVAPAARPRRVSVAGTHLVAWLIGAYAVVLALIAFWPVPVDRGASAFIAAITRAFPWATYDLIEFTANILLFVPLGVLGALLLRPRGWLVVPLAFIASVTIEAGQAILLDQRTSSALDVIANTTGAVVGLLVVVLVMRWRSSRAER